MLGRSLKQQDSKLYSFPLIFFFSYIFVEDTLFIKDINCFVSSKRAYNFPFSNKQPDCNHILSCICEKTGKLVSSSTSSQLCTWSLSEACGLYVRCILISDRSKRLFMAETEPKPNFGFHSSFGWNWNRKPKHQINWSLCFYASLKSYKQIIS